MVKYYIFDFTKYYVRRSQCPRGLRRRSTAASLLRSWVRIPPGTWMFVCCECCVLSGRGLCDELITRPEESYRLWRVAVCDQETSYTRRIQPRQSAVKYKPTMGCSASIKKSILRTLYIVTTGLYIVNKNSTDNRYAFYTNLTERSFLGQPNNICLFLRWFSVTSNIPYLKVVNVKFTLLRVI